MVSNVSLDLLNSPTESTIQLKPLCSPTKNDKKEATVMEIGFKRQ